MKRDTSARTSTAKDLGTILANQSDPAYMAAVARQRAAVQAGKVWRYNRKSGEWVLRKVVDGTTKPTYDIIVYANSESPQDHDEHGNPIALIRPKEQGAA